MSGRLAVVDEVVVQIRCLAVLSPREIAISTDDEEFIDEGSVLIATLPQGMRALIGRVAEIRQHECWSDWSVLKLSAPMPRDPKKLPLLLRGQMLHVGADTAVG